MLALSKNHNVTLIILFDLLVFYFVFGCVCVMLDIIPAMKHLYYRILLIFMYHCCRYSFSTLELDSLWSRIFS